MTKEELKKVLELHKLWLENGEKGERADLRSADLRYADLRYANLSSADLRSADLRSADLRSANLSYANLSYANLSSANLSSADLRYANLYRAKINVESLKESCCGELLLAQQRICPDGPIIGWKKALVDGERVIVKLRIPASAKRLNSFGSRKCRASKAKVISAYTLSGFEVSEEDEIVSQHDRKFRYKVGEYVEVDNFDDSLAEECSKGIHFFITREEAVAYDG